MSYKQHIIDTLQCTVTVRSVDIQKRKKRKKKKKSCLKPFIDTMYSIDCISLWSAEHFSTIILCVRVFSTIIYICESHHWLNQICFLFRLFTLLHYHQLSHAFLLNFSKNPTEMLQPHFISFFIFLCNENPLSKLMLSHNLPMIFPLVCIHVNIIKMWKPLSALYPLTSSYLFFFLLILPSLRLTPTGLHLE